jgi:hypothetical protein
MCCNLGATSIGFVAPTRYIEMEYASFVAPGAHACSCRARNIVVLERGSMPNDLNVSWRNRASTAMMAVAFVCSALSFYSRARLLITFFSMISTLLLHVKSSRIQSSGNLLGICRRTDSITFSRTTKVGLSRQTCLSAFDVCLR